MSRFERTIWATVFGVLVLTALAVLLLGCSDPPPDAGVVVDKRHEAAYDVHYTTYVCTYRDPKTAVCYIYAPVYNVDHHPERWRLEVRDCSDEDKCRTGWVTVTEDAYGRYEVGDYWRKAGA